MHCASSGSLEQGVHLFRSNCKTAAEQDVLSVAAEVRMYAHACMLARTQPARSAHWTHAPHHTLPRRKAFLNYRYHARRALYLSAIASHLRATPPFSDRPMRLEACQHDPARPVLVLGPPHSSPGRTAAGAENSRHSSSGSSSGSGVELRLLPCMPPSAFPLAKLAPDRNCVRAVCQTRPAGSTQQQPQNQGEQKDPTPKEQEAAEAALLPTPAYNAGVMADCCMLLHAALLQRSLLANPKLADGLLLLKVGACGVWTLAVSVSA